MRIIITTFANEADAARVVRQLVEESLAACGTLLPAAKSIYRWQAALCEETECVVWLKTSEEMCTALCARLAELHPYQVPEICTLTPTSINPSYHAWLQESTTQALNSPIAAS